MSKDWTGNKRSTFVTLGASNHCDHDREMNDFYATDPRALEMFLTAFAIDGLHLHENIWEPACGMGHLSKVLEDLGHNVLSTDLIDRGYGIVNSDTDFLNGKYYTHTKFDGDILTNPPYKYAKEFVETCYDFILWGDTQMAEQGDGAVLSILWP